MSKIKHESDAVQTYIATLQGIINRMASNSAAVKTWCITLTSAVIVLAADSALDTAVWVAAFPLVACLLLDCYYLGLERAFRRRYNSFIARLGAGKARSEELFVVSAENHSVPRSTLGALFSPSIWPFYGLLVAMLFAIDRWLM
jgi:hypothetical protein